MLAAKNLLREQIEELVRVLREYAVRVLELEEQLAQRDEVLRAHGNEARALAEVIAASSATVERARDRSALRGYLLAAGPLAGYGAWFVAGLVGSVQPSQVTDRIIAQAREEHPMLFGCMDRVEMEASAALRSIHAWDVAARAVEVHTVTLNGDGYELCGSDKHDRYDARPGPDPAVWRVTAGSSRAGPTARFDIVAFAGANALKEASTFLELDVDEPGALVIVDPAPRAGSIPTSALLLRRARLRAPGV